MIGKIIELGEEKGSRTVKQNSPAVAKTENKFAHINTCASRGG